jgi:hypothetical protein
MSYLFNERMDRKKVYRWMTTLVCRPDIRMHYSLLLVSEQQGVGKTTLFESILAPLVGLWNCSFPTEADITDSSFNGWVSHKRLAVVNEIYGNRKRKTYDKIKSLITDANIEVNRKYQEAYKVTNYIHLGANSNSIHAIHIDDEDRRLMPPRVTDRIRDPAYWKQFYQWLHTGGLEIICWFLHELAKDHRMIVETGERAPYTSMKGEMIEASRSEGQQLAHEMAEYLMRKTDPSVMAINDVRAWIASKRGINVDSDKLEKPTTIIKAMRFAKVKVIKDVEGKPDRFMVDDRRSYLIANFDHEPTETQSWHTFKDKRRVPEEIWPMGVSH